MLLNTDYFMDDVNILSSNKAKRNIIVIPNKNPILTTRKRFNSSFSPDNNVGN